MMPAPLGNSKRRAFVFRKKQRPQAFETVGSHAARVRQLSQRLFDPRRQ